MQIKFPDLYTQVIYNYLKLHDGELILYRDIMDKFPMCYTTVRRRVNWLIDHNYIRKEKRRISIIPQF